MHPSAHSQAAAEILIRDEVPRDGFAREILLDKAFGLNRHRKSSERLREGRLPAEGLAFTALRDNVLVGTLRLWDIETGDGRKALLLGPIAISPTLRSKGLGGQMIRMALEKAAALGHEAVILVGDEPYYRRFGFARTQMAGLDMPGPVDPARFLGIELREGALEGAFGLLRPAGRPAPADAPRRKAA
ncbi:GNAT family N-acetyltransferase [Rhodoblastus sphagnicola]|uniref:GNAT family N-acetyltransferase n=1 Tax=Rhodoblastus sphagnicola TaxID=333368 RepID=A0A2S6NE38_9HYPH|nr:N-acetyltransferase [Rhodoblastus sphagnicola]MBB4198540.1 putative N-acetyltransferase YhbS [Rhodoblastus sphagnicola]PPQ32871.1 GNAT family N-acetyltransferase [Rhodoblastus sphagnicola]